jgi:hypothetical protein
MIPRSREEIAMTRRSRKANPDPAIAQSEAPEIENASPSDLKSPLSPRPDSKLGIVLGLLQRDEGASLAKLTAVTNWLPHTTRAAVTGLRKRGYAIATEKVTDADGSKRSIYRIVTGQAQ